MRYSHKRNYPYPVLRPYSRDYGESASFSTTLGRPAIDPDANELRLSVAYNVDVASVGDLLDAGSALCGAMIYCSTTLFRKFFTAEIGAREVNATVPLSHLCRQVEIHPAIIANGEFSHTFEGKIDEYGDRVWEIGTGKPLAADQSWHFSLDPHELESTESIFRLRSDENVEADEVRVNVDTGARYIDIFANPRTFANMQSLRNQGVDTAILCLYLGPLMEGLRTLAQIEEGDEVDEGPWVAALRAKLSYFGLWPLDDGRSLFEVAQQIFSYPYGRVQGTQRTEDGQ